MRDSFQPLFESFRTQIVARVAAVGISPAALSVAAFAISLVALPLIAREYYVAGFAIFVLGRLVEVFTAAEAGGRMRLVLDGIVYASVPFAFALADPTRALAACFLLFGFVVVCSVSERRARPIDALICIVAFAIPCFAPSWFGVIAYGLGIACFVVTGVRLAWSAA
ncbi:MAG TPA: hypothetical protein VF146_20635 [Bryobacteraceae bacterium]